MARRKINLQTINTVKESGGIDDLVRDMGSSELGFSPTEHSIYEVDLDRILPDFSQPRRFLPFDLRQQLSQGEILPGEAMRELLSRAERGDQLAALILGDSGDSLNDDEDGPEDEKGLLALARSVKTVGLRQPINVYSITRPDAPGETFYQLGEGERRYWAHQLLALQGDEKFARIRCIIDTLPEDKDLIQRRQQAENAARQDLSAIARSRSIEQIQERLRLTMGTRVPGETTIKLPSQRDLDAAVGQEVKTFTGRAIGGRMVRNYLRLLKLSPELQDLVEAAQLTEKQLRPVMRLKTEAEQRQLIIQIINQRLSGRDVLSKVAPTAPVSSLKQVKRTTIEQRLEKRLFQAAMTVHEIITLGEESYAAIVEGLAGRVSDEATRDALLKMRQLIDDLVGNSVLSDFGVYQDVSLDTILPPIDHLRRSLSDTHWSQLTNAQAEGGKEVLQLLQQWKNDDPLAASRLTGFFKSVDEFAEKLRAGEGVFIPGLEKVSNSGKYMYQVTNGKTIYWANILRGLMDENIQGTMRAEVFA